MEEFARICMWVDVIAGTALLTMWIRRSERFGNNRGPIPPRTLNFLAWIIFLAGLGITAWRFKNNWVW